MTQFDGREVRSTATFHGVPLLAVRPKTRYEPLPSVVASFVVEPLLTRMRTPATPVSPASRTPFAFASAYTRSPMLPVRPVCTRFEGVGGMTTWLTGLAIASKSV